MLTFEMLYAVLQGLPSSYLDHLDKEWIRFCVQIQLALEKGHDPISALRTAIQNAEGWQIESMRRSFKKMHTVMHLTGLTYRQKETLAALRVAGVASLAQLSRVLMRDRSDIHKRLAALVKKGLAIKFFRPGGVYYLAVSGPLQRSVKSAAHQAFFELMENLLADPNSKATKPPIPPTSPTSPKHTTFPTSPTPTPSLGSLDGVALVGAAD